MLNSVIYKGFWKKNLYKIYGDFCQNVEKIFKKKNSKNFGKMFYVFFFLNFMEILRKILKKFPEYFAKVTQGEFLRK